MTGPVDFASPQKSGRVARDCLPILVAVAIPTLIAITRLPPGICFGDSGDLQLSSVTLGIAHPPGYPILSTIGYVMTRIPFIDPAYVISLACAMSGAIAAFLCGMIQIRLGVHPWIAATATVLFLAHPRVWFNIIAPEVYLPAMAMLAGAVYCFLRYSDSGSRRSFFASTFLFGLALFTRPPTLFSLPFFLLATVLIDKRRKIPAIQTARRTLLGALVMILPGLYSFGFILARDRSDVPYNYIDLHNAESKALPEATSGMSARVERAVWTMTGQQYAAKMRTSGSEIRSKLAWIREEVFPVGTATLIPILAIVVAGMLGTWKRQKPAALVLIGFVFQTVVFLCAYQVKGQEANLLPLLASVVILGGVAISDGIARLAKRRQTYVAAGIAILSACSVTAYLISRPDIRSLIDATDAVAQADLATFPQDSVIISAWAATAPLRYAHFFSDRPDIHIATVSHSRWAEFARGLGGRPVFVPRIDKKLAEAFRVTPFRSLYLLEPRETTGNN